jgi:hypothetical protein
VVAGDFDGRLLWRTSLNVTDSGVLGPLPWVGPTTASPDGSVVYVMSNEPHRVAGVRVAPVVPVRRAPPRPARGVRRVMRLPSQVMHALRADSGAILVSVLAAALRTCRHRSMPRARGEGGVTWSTWTLLRRGSPCQQPRTPGMPAHWLGAQWSTALLGSAVQLLRAVPALASDGSSLFVPLAETCADDYGCLSNASSHILRLNATDGAVMLNVTLSPIGPGVLARVVEARAAVALSSDERTVFFSTHTLLRAVDAATGALLWTSDLLATYCAQLSSFSCQVRAPPPPPTYCLSQQRCVS